jgi:hypothetical protein
MDAGLIQRVIRGVDGNVIPVIPARFDETRAIVSNYYADHFEVTRGLVGDNDLEFTLFKHRVKVPVQRVVAVLEPVLVILSSAHQHLRTGEAYCLATYVGPLIGHFSRLEIQQIPAILGRDATLRQKHDELEAIFIGLHGMSEGITALEVLAHKWRAQGPGSAHRSALGRAQAGQREIMMRFIAGMGPDADRILDARIEEIPQGLEED